MTNAGHLNCHPPVKNRKLAFTGIFIGELFALTGFGFIVPILPLVLQNEMHVTTPHGVELWNGVIIGISGVSLAIFAPIWGAMADKRGKRLMLLRALFGGGVISLISSFVVTPTQLLLVRILQGCFTGSVAAATVLVADLSTKEDMGANLGLLQVIIFAGNSLGPWVGGFLYDRVGYKTTYMVAGALILSAGIIVRLVVPEMPIRVHADMTKSGKRKMQWKDFIPDFSVLKGAPFLILLLSIVFFSQSAFVLVRSIIALFVQAISPDVRNVGSVSGTIIGLTAVASALGAVIFGKLSKKFRFQYLLLISFTGAAICYLPQAVAHNWKFLLIFRSIDSFFVGGVMPGINAMIAFSAPKAKQGSVFGLSAALSSASGALGPAAGGVIAAGIGLRPVFFIGSAMLFALIVALLIHREKWLTRDFLAESDAC